MFRKTLLWEIAKNMHSIQPKSEHHSAGERTIQHWYAAALNVPLLAMSHRCALLQAKTQIATIYGQKEDNKRTPEHAGN